MADSSASLSRLLWKKETRRSQFYTDFYSEMIKSDLRKFVDNRLREALTEQVKKNDDASARFQKLGARQFCKRKWREATELYNIAVCTAKNGSDNLRLSYKARSICFTNRRMAEEAKIDIELSSEPPKKAKENIGRLQREPSITSQVQRLFIPNEKFPNLASALEIRQNTEFGRHVVAKRDIPVGQTIALNAHFAGSVCTRNELKQRQAYCLTCFSTDANFIPCRECTDVMFCSDTCRQTNTVHRLECQSLYHRLTSATVKLAIQMVLVAVEQFSNADALIAFVEGIVNGADDLNELQNDAFPSYGVILKLKSCPSNSDVKRAYEAFELMMKTMPKIRRYFDSSPSQRFLMHLLVHQLGIIRMNAFEEICGWTKNLFCKYLHDIISLFNHSCAPNAYYMNQSTVGQLVTVRPIKRGDQVFINYLGDVVDRLRDYRRRYIEKYWHFFCKCDRCEPPTNEAERVKNERDMFADPDFQYFLRHRDHVHLPADNERRIRLKQVCVNILSKYGHIWSSEMNTIQMYLILMI